MSIARFKVNQGIGKPHAFSGMGVQHVPSAGLGHGKLQARQPHGLGLQISPGVGDGVLVTRCSVEMSGSGAASCYARQPRAWDHHHAGSINRDQVHLLVSIPPSLSVSRAVQYLKGRHSREQLSEFASLRKRYWGQHLWARGYWVASSGNMTDEVCGREYVKTKPRQTRRRLQCDRSTGCAEEADPGLRRNVRRLSGGGVFADEEVLVGRIAGAFTVSSWKSLGPRRQLAQRAILGVSVDTMLRASDLLSLRVSTVRDDNGMIRESFTVGQRKDVNRSVTSVV